MSGTRANPNILPYSVQRPLSVVHTQASTVRGEEECLYSLARSRLLPISSDLACSPV